METTKMPVMRLNMAAIRQMLMGLRKSLYIILPVLEKCTVAIHDMQQALVWLCHKHHIRLMASHRTLHVMPVFGLLDLVRVHALLLRACLSQYHQAQRDQVRRYLSGADV
jgi:hypothetical protein